MNGVLPILKKEFREVVRDPYTLGIAVFLPIVLLFVFGYGLNLDFKDVSLAVVDLDSSPESRAYIDALVNTGKFDLRHRPASPQEAGQLLDQGSVQAAVIIPFGFSRELRGGGTARAQTLLDGSFPSSARVVQGYIEGVNESFAASWLSDELAARGMGRGAHLSAAVIGVPRVRYNQSLESANFIIPGLVGVILMAFPPLLSALAVVREKERGSVQQLFISPLRPWAFIIGKLLPYVVISFLELLLVLLIARYWFGIPSVGNIWLLVLASVPYVVSTVGIGLLVSALVRSQLVAMIAVIAFTMMPAFVFSGFMYSISNMPAPLQFYSYALPGRYYLEIIRGVFLRGVGPEVWAGQLGSLILYTAILITIASLRFKKKVD